jgi:glycerophosphoryl diester phosphodiesterase
MSRLDWLTARPVAHRGLHDGVAVIENTPSAVAAAIAAGYGVEVDLQITADGEAMVHHDDALGRLTEGEGHLAALTAAELKRVPFRQTSDRMMTLGDLVDLVAGRTTLVLELKSHWDGDPRLVERICRTLGRSVARLAAMSFDPWQIAGIREQAPALPRGIVAERRRDRGDAAQTGAVSRLVYGRGVFRARPQFIAYHVKDLPGTLPLLARNMLGLPVLAWTVRGEDDRRRAERWADQIIFEGFRP